MFAENHSDVQVTRLRELGLFNLKKRERPYSSLPVLKGGYRKDGEGLLIRECRDRMRHDSFKLKEGRFRLSMRRNSLL